MKSTNPEIETALFKHRFQTEGESVQNGGVKIDVPGGVVTIWPTGTVQQQGTPTPDALQAIQEIAAAVGRKP